MYFLAPTSISTISPDRIIVAKTCAKNSGTCSAIWLNSIVLTTLVFSLVRNFPTTFYLYLPGARTKFFLASVISFYWSHVLWKITLPNDSFISESCSRNPHVNFLFVSGQIYLFYCSYIQIWFVSWFLYLSKSVHASTCFLKIPIKVKIFLSIFSLQSIAHNCCLFCSVKNKFSDTYWNWRSRQWSHCYAWSLRSAYFFKVAQRMFFLRGGREIDERALVTIANQNFCCLSNWKIHSLVC